MGRGMFSANHTSFSKGGPTTLLFRINAEYSQLWRSATKLTSVFTRLRAWSDDTYTGAWGKVCRSYVFNVGGETTLQISSILGCPEDAAGRWRCFTLRLLAAYTASSYITAIQQVSVSCVCGTRSSADADNRLDAFSGQSRSTNMVPFHM